MRFPLPVILAAVALVTVALAVQPASAGPFNRRGSDPAASSACANGQCANGQCSRLRKKIEVDVTVAPPAVNVEPATVNVTLPAKAEEKPAPEPPANKAEKTALLLLLFAATALLTGGYLLHQRIHAQSKS